MDSREDKPASIDLTQIVGTIAAELNTPFYEFVARLRADGRITDAEIEEVMQAVKDRGERLGELVQAALQAKGS